MGMIIQLCEYTKSHWSIKQNWDKDIYSAFTKSSYINEYVLQILKKEKKRKPFPQKPGESSSCNSTLETLSLQNLWVDGSRISLSNAINHWSRAKGDPDSCEEDNLLTCNHKPTRKYIFLWSAPYVGVVCQGIRWRSTNNPTVYNYSYKQVNFKGRKLIP